MKLFRDGFVVAAAVLACFGCLPASTTPNDGGGGTAATVTYTKDVQPILMVKCMPCHTGQGAGNRNIGTTYGDAFKLIESVDSFGCWNDTDPPKRSASARRS